MILCNTHAVPKLLERRMRSNLG